MNAPIGILYEEVLDVTDLAIARMNMIPGDRINAAKMWVIVTLKRGCNILGASRRPYRR